MKSGPQRPHLLWLKRAAYAVFLALVAWFYLSAGQKQALDRITMHPGLHEARHLALAGETVGDLTLDFSRGVSEPLRRWLPHRTDGVVQPLWPWLAAWTGAKDAPAVMIAAGAWLQLGMTLGFLLVLGVAGARSFSFPAAALVVLMVGFQGLLPLVGQFNGGALFQILFLLTWAVCLHGLQRNSLWVYGMAGGLGALAYLTDERVLPLLLAFAFVSTMRAVWQWVAEHWPRQFGGATTLWVPRNHLLGALLMMSLFGFIAGPRLAESHRRFGTAFFQYQDHVRWLDGTAEAERWIEEHPDARTLAAVPPGEWPCLNHYLRDHSATAAWERLRTGVAAVLGAFGRQGGGEVAVLFVLLIAMAAVMPLATPKAQHAGQRLHPETVPAVFFVALSVAVYLGIAGWDAAVTGSDQRLLLLQPALVVGAVWAAESLRRRARRRQAQGGFLLGYRLVVWLLLALQSWRVIQGLQGPPSAP